MSDQETTADQEENKDTEETATDSLADLQELEKIKQELMKEKEKAAKELAEGEEEGEDLREVDYLHRRPSQQSQ